MITRIKWINIPFFSNDCWFFGMSIMRTLEMHYQCESQVQHHYYLDSPVMLCLCPKTYSIAGTLFLSLVSSCLPGHYHCLGGLCSSWVEFCCCQQICSYYLFLNIHIQKHIHIQISIYRLWTLQPATLLNLLFLKFFCPVSFLVASSVYSHKIMPCESWRVFLFRVHVFDFSCLRVLCCCCYSAHMYTSGYSKQLKLL